ncbi:tricarballylate/proton symporter TcuC [Novosphingobium sp. 9]|uniref:tricarballylate/proton symporter TcuC n=1 Tax=Novosphingobium sp. 9 TaxID=2025349 RepID=UPI0021B68E33|nr:tricarballylate/proton symporter TcuC [Novosphingobium sp. 9]
MSEQQRAQGATAGDVFRIASGNFLEMYDFMVFGYFAAAIGQAYFPSGDNASALLKSLATFGAGFLMRPLGAIVLGGFTDRHGRRAGLLLTLALMSVGIVTLTFTPAYATIGVLAPVLVLFGRLIQGFSAGAELGNVSVYLAEIAPPQHKGFFVSWQSASQQVAVVFAAVVGVALSRMLGPDQLAAWGWRVPLGLGCLLVPLLFLLRRHLKESDEFENRPPPASLGTVLGHLWKSRGIVLTGLGMVMMTTVSFYMITAYTPTFGKLLHLPEEANLWVTAGVGASNLIWLPLMGALSDRIGRKPILLACTVLMLLTAYPAMIWLATEPSVVRLIAVELWLSALYASYNSAMVVYLTEIVPAEVRASGFSLAYSLATAVGGFTPFLVTWAIGATHNRAIPGVWLSVIALVSLIAVLAAGRQRRSA